MPAIPHGGDLEAASRRWGIPPGRFLDFSASVGPVGLPEAARAAVSAALPRLDRYPDPSASALRTALARRHGRPESEVLVTAGATGALTLAVRAAAPRFVGVLAPCYRDVERAAAQAGALVDFHMAEESRGFAFDWAKAGAWLPGHDLVLLGTPNNPTGRAVAPEASLALADAAPRAVLLVDESFLDFLPGADAWSLAASSAARPNVVVLRSLTKFYAMPGLRVGYAVGPEPALMAMAACAEPWAVGTLAQEAALACLADASYARTARAVVEEERGFLAAGLEAAGFAVHPSQANFLLVRGRNSAASLVEHLGRRGLLVRDASDFPGLGPDHVRIAVRARADNQILLSALGGLAHAAS